ncbi:hypothetical protein ACF1AJ_20030 [Leifsonia sp. NPDC014704]|uniref:hypothetical protein n=1 Tax=unclassified Leifsonia TaxID=2663824 RepID=UPI000A18ED30|nr:hypothetical protein [Leifsonia sp. NCR5]
MVRKNKEEPPRRRSTHEDVKPTPEQLRARYLRKRRFLRIGQGLMAIGLIVGLQHWLAHLGVFGAQPPGWVDLAAGYPLAAVLLVGGAITAGQK